MNYADLKICDVANGTGVRVSLFVSGCTHRCKGCFNAEAWDFNYGKPFTEDSINDVLTALDHDYIEGLSLLGGEPFEPQNQPELVKLLRKVKEKFPNKNIWCYTGYLLDEDIMPCRLGDPDITRELISYIDVLVDGEFIEEQKDLHLRFRGSANQRIIDVQKSLETGAVVPWDGEMYI